MRALAVSASRGFKLFRTPSRQAAIAVVVIAAIAGMIGTAIVQTSMLTGKQVPPGRFTMGAVIAVGLLALYAVAAALLTPLALGASSLLHRLFRSGKAWTVLGTAVVVLAFGWIPARLHLLIFDRLYLRAGRVRPRETGGANAATTSARVRATPAQPTRESPAA
jgi:hypothetical protein